MRETKNKKLQGVWPGLLALCLLPVALPAAAEIYKYRDREGHVIFTDKPMKRADTRLVWTKSDDGMTTRPAGSGFNAERFRRNLVRYSPMIDATARRFDLQPELLHAVVRVESSYDPHALSRAGAKGLMQLMPDTARRYGVYDSWDPEQNLYAGASYLRDLLEQFQFDLRLALAAYNAGENAVKKYGYQIPPYPETQHYVRKVLAAYQGNPLY